MQQFLVLFREPDGRKDPHTPEEVAQHCIIGGMPLTLSGRVLHGASTHHQGAATRSTKVLTKQEKVSPHLSPKALTRSEKK